MGDAQRRADFLDLADTADDLEFRALAHGYSPEFPSASGSSGGVPSVTPRKTGREPATSPAARG